MAILTDFPIASAIFNSKRIYCSTNEIINNFGNILCDKRLIRKWTPHELIEDNNIERLLKFKLLLNFILVHKEKNFSTIITLDESWFYFEY